MFNLKPLPYNKSALAPHMSAQTLELHYGKHHQAYVDNLNKLIAETEFVNVSLEDIIIKTAGKIDQTAIFNNAGQVHNHNFFWQCLKPTAISSEPQARIKDLIEKTFGDLENFYKEFKIVALSQFGSGWAWLVLENSELKIVKTTNADNPLTKGLKPLLGIDVWEHSYYLDYQNRRADFLDAILRNLINWEFVESNLQIN